MLSEEYINKLKAKVKKKRAKKRRENWYKGLVNQGIDPKTYYKMSLKYKRGRIPAKTRRRMIRERMKKIPMYAQPNFKIITTSRDKHVSTLGTYEKLSDARKAFKNFVKENRESVEMPRRWVKFHGDLFEACDEIYIVKKKKRRDKNLTNDLKNEYGVPVEHSVSGGRWIPMDKETWLVEEKFWVLGYNPYTDRKPLSWILGNFIIRDTGEHVTAKSIALYSMLILIKTGSKTEVIKCKNKKQSIELYNRIEEFCSRYKMRYNHIMFMGDLGDSYDISNWITKIADITGWSRIKVEFHM